MFLSRDGYRRLRRSGGVLVGRLARWLSGRVPVRAERGPRRGPVDHVIILDGTMSTLEDGYETNAGRLFLMLDQARHDGAAARMSLYYEAGIQWTGWRTTWHVATGVGLNQQIRRAYGVLATRYRPGDRIFLFGYSRGAFAVRSLAGMIGSVGLLRPEAAVERNLVQAYRHYRAAETGRAARAFSEAHCHQGVEVEMIGVWDTVKALGLTWPVVWRWFDETHRFHNADLGPHVKHGYHALARDETRDAYAPVLWSGDPGHPGHVEQVWFPGTHGDVGGQLNGDLAARPLANLSLVWMAGRAEALGLALPEGWRAALPVDPGAPSVGTLRGWGKTFVLRHKRRVGEDPTERLWSEVEPILPRAS